MQVVTDMTIYHNQWTHFAITFNNNNNGETSNAGNIYINGIEQSLTFYTSGGKSFVNGTTAYGPIFIGRYRNGAEEWLNSELKHLRVYNNVKYNSNFTIDTSNYTIISNPYSTISDSYYDSNLLLYLPSDTQINNSDINIYYRILVDNSPLNNNITSSITNDNKFSINNINSIGEFKDTKHIVVDNNPEFNLSNKDFTIEFWFYLKNSSGTPESSLINQCVGDGVEHSSYCLFFMPSKKIKLFIVENNSNTYNFYIETINTYEYNKYYHLSIVRIDTEIIFFINGIKQLVNYYKYGDNSIISSNTAIVNGLIFNKSYQPIIIGGFRQNLTFGGHILSVYKFTGYMDQIKLTVGKANYFDNFEVSNIYSINSDIKQILFHQDDFMTIYIDKEEEYNLEHYNDSLVIETIQSKKNKLYVDVKVDNEIITLENNTPINCSSYDVKLIKQNDSIHLYVNDNPSKKVKAKNINNGSGLLYIGKDKNENNYNGYISKFNISKTNKYDLDLFNKYNINDTLNSKILLNNETIFNGTTDYTSTNNNFTESFTVAFYIKPNITSTTSDFYPIISEISSNGFICNIQLQYIENDGLKLQILSGNSNNTINILNDNFNNNKWSHVLLTYDNSSIISNLYINGLLVESNQGTENINLSLSNETIQIGKTLNSGEICYLKGSLKQILLFNKVLSNNEIKQLSNIPLLYNTYAEFTGNNIIVPYNLLNNINSNYDKFTIEFWFKDISSETGETIILNEENTFKVYYKINSNSESILGIILNNTKYEYTIDRNTYFDSWFHIAFIVSDSVKLFINSDLVEITSTSTSTSLKSNIINNLNIGYSDNNYNNLSYQIKKLKLWNSERTKVDIELSYSNNDKYLEKISHLQYVNVDDLILYIPFNIYNSYIFYKDYKIFNNNNQTIDFIDNLLDIKLDNNLIKANIKTSGDDLEIINNSEIQYNNWYHIALVRNENKINLYIDGIKNNDTLILNELNKTNNYVTIGSQGNEITTHNHFNGYIDEIKFNNSVVYTNNFNVPTNSLLSDTSIEDNYVNQILTSNLDGSYDLRDLLLFVSFNEDYNSSYTIISYKSSSITFKTDGKTLGNLSIYSDKESFNINDLTNHNLTLVNGGGNVGIGVEEPHYKLHLDGQMLIGNKYQNDGGIPKENVQFIIGGSHNSTNYYNNASDGVDKAKLLITGYNNDSDNGSNYIYPILCEDENAQKDFYIRSVNNDELGATGYFRGNVGIGTDSPTKKLEIYHTTNPSILFSHNSVDGCEIGIYDDHAYIWNRANTPIKFATGGGYRMTISEDGNVGIGESNPSYPLHITGGGDSPDDTITKPYFTGSGGYVASGVHHGNTISMYSSGSIYCNLNYLLSSDERIKTNIEELIDNEALIKFRQLKPCKYNYIDTVSRGSKEVYGFIAQEIKEVIPYAVNIAPANKYIPNVYKLALYNNNIITFEQAHNLDSDGTVKLILSNDKEITVPYTIIDTLKINIDVSELSDDEKPSNDLVQDDDGNDLAHNIFVYGISVDDFHTLNKDAIWTTAAAALQEVDRIQQADAVKIQTLETKNTELETEVLTLKTELVEQKNKVSTLENQLSEILNRISTLENN